MRRRNLLDSYALLAYLNREAGFEKVLKAFVEAEKKSRVVLMNEINIGETFYIVFRKRGPEKAEYLLETILPGLPIQRVANTYEDVIRAARLKAERPLSFADCFAVATAIRENASILTGDPEFKRVEDLAAIDWLTQEKPTGTPGSPGP